MLWFWESVKCVWAELTMPSNSARRPGSTLSFLILTRLSSSCLPMLEVSVRAKNKTLWRCSDLTDERSLLRSLALPINQRKENRIYLTQQYLLRILQSRINLRVIQLVSNHDEIDVT